MKKFKSKLNLAKPTFKFYERYGGDQLLFNI